MSALAPVTAKWLKQSGFSVKNADVWLDALTHGSMGSARDYQRLEFLGDRVLGLAIAEWLYRNKTGAEGKLALRLNALVSKDTCAKIAREIGVHEHVFLGKQAREDGASDSDNVLGDVMEALIGAEFLENGADSARALTLRLWHSDLANADNQGKHPKSALQEWAAGNKYKAPKYDLIDRSGPDHKASFTVRVSIAGLGEAKGVASNKQDAEKRAAQKFMEDFG